MASGEIIVGEFSPFIDGLEVAHLSGQRVDLTTGRLGLHPPYRSPGEGDLMDFEDAMYARLLARKMCGLMDLAQEVGRIEHTTSYVVISRTGALAIRSSDNDDALQKGVSLLEHLDDGHESELLSTHPIRIG